MLVNLYTKMMNAMQRGTYEEFDAAREELYQACIEADKFRNPGNYRIAKGALPHFDFEPGEPADE